MKYRDKFIVKPGEKVKLDKIDASFKDKHEDEHAAAEEIAKHVHKMRELQYLLYAENKRSLLIVLQAMDAAGKDGTINHVLGGMNPQGTRVHGFKAPSTEEAAHDFLWRIHKNTPRKGEVAIFNRSHYEDVLVTRVHSLVPKKVWEKRYDLINEFEKNLVESGTHIVKFYLHITKDEQLRRFKQRLDDPARHWKISAADYKERELWDDYTKAFEDAIGNCSTKHAPWYVIPANHKWFRNLAVSKIIAETLESLKMSFPKPTVDIKEIVAEYHEAEEETMKEKGGTVRLAPAESPTKRKRKNEIALGSRGQAVEDRQMVRSLRVRSRGEYYESVYCGIHQPVHDPAGNYQPPGSHSDLSESSGRERRR